MSQRDAVQFFPLGISILSFVSFPSFFFKIYVLLCSCTRQIKYHQGSLQCYDVAKSRGGIYSGNDPTFHSLVQCAFEILLSASEIPSRCKDFSQCSEAAKAEGER